MHYTIYKTTNNVNGKYYIGKHQTQDLNDGYMGSGKLLKRAIKKYGLDKFSKELLFVFENEEEMNEKEKDLVVISSETYNLCEGGQGGFGFVNINKMNLKGVSKGGVSSSKIFWHRMETDSQFNIKIKKSWFESRRGNKNSLGRRWKHKYESVIKQKETFNSIQHQQGEKNSQFGTCWITNGQENKKIKLDQLDIWLEKNYYKGRKTA